MKRIICLTMAIILLLATPLTTCGIEIPETQYELSEEERILLEYAVMSEASTDFFGQALIAECALNTALLNELTIPEVIEQYQWVNRGVEPSESCKWAIKSVFDFGYSPSEGGLITIFYNPKLLESGRSSYHESQSFVLEWNNVRFFRENKFNDLVTEENDMNATRRKEIDALIEQMNVIIARANSLSEAEQEAYDNLPESFQDSERGEIMENAIDNLETAITSLEEALEFLAAAREGN